MVGMTEFSPLQGRGRLASPAWRSQSFEMDQELVLGQIASAGDHWVGYARTGTVLVDMVANAIVPEMLRLTRVVDVDRSGLGRASEDDQS